LRTGRVCRLGRPVCKLGQVRPVCRLVVARVCRLVAPTQSANVSKRVKTSLQTGPKIGIYEVILFATNERSESDDRPHPAEHKNASSMSEFRSAWPASPRSLSSSPRRPICMHRNLLVNLGHSGPPKAKKAAAAAHAGHAYSWVKKYAIIVSDDQPCSSSKRRHPMAIMAKTR